MSLTPSSPGRTPAPGDVLRLLALIVQGSRAPAISRAGAAITAWIPFEALDDLSACGAGLDPVAVQAGPPDTSGAWSGVLLPMLRTAERLLPTIFHAIGRIEPEPGGGVEIAFTLDLADHDLLALWGASLDLVAHLIPAPPPPPGLPLTALELGVPQEMASIVLDLYAAETRPSSEPPTIASAA